MSLEQLINLCTKRDSRAQEQIYRLYESKLYSVCLKYSRNKQEAEDNLQDSFLTIFDKMHQFNFNGSFEGWMKRIAINTVLQKYRKEGVFEIIKDDIEDDVELSVEEDGVTLDFLLKIIQELPDRYRLTFNLYVIDGYSHKEIASMLKINEGTSKSNLSRAKMILKAKIEENGLKKNVHSL